MLSSNSYGLTRSFTCQIIASPFARIAVASFYVYGLLAVRTYGLLALLSTLNLLLLMKPLDMIQNGS